MTLLAGGFWPVPQEFEISLESGARLIVPGQRVGLPYCLWTTGIYEHLTTCLIGALVPRRVFYDIGANIGYYTVIASRAGATQVIAFEPFPPNFAYLERNVHLNQRSSVRLFSCAVGSQKGKIVLYDGAEFGNGSVSGTSVVSAREVARVPIESLDELIQREDLAAPDILKIDVEGYEGLALQGMRATLEQARPILFLELNEPLLAAVGTSSVEIVRMLRTVGYTEGYDLDGRRIAALVTGRTFNALLAPGQRAGELAHALAMIE